MIPYDVRWGFDGATDDASQNNSTARFDITITIANKLGTGYYTHKKEEKLLLLLSKINGDAKVVSGGSSC